MGSSVEVDSSVTTCSAARVFSAGSWYTSGGSARRAACSFAASSSSSMLLLSIPSTAASDRGISVSERVLDEKQSATLIRRQVRLNWRQHSASSDCSPFSLPDSPLSKRTSNRLKMSRSKSSSRRSRSWQRKRGERRGSRGAISHSVWMGALATTRPETENSCQGGGTNSERPAYTRVNPKIRGNANLAGAWSAQPVPASPPRAAHRTAAARAPRTTPACTCGHAVGRSLYEYHRHHTLV